jgi:hypothetical protein
VRRPDYQVISKATREVVEIDEVGTGSRSSLLRKLRHVDNYKTIADQLESRPTMTLEYEVTPSPMSRIGGVAGKLFIPLMLLEMYLDIQDYENSPAVKWGNKG